MGFDWAEYLSLAENLCALPVSGSPIGREAQRRAAVSRAYYAAFILARNHLRDVDHIHFSPQVNAHQFVAARYFNHPDPVRQAIGWRLRRLRRARNECDYDDVAPNLSNLIPVALVWSAQVVADLGRL
jgi:hypothetical protein